jgi:hypothetical protein
MKTVVLHVGHPKTGSTSIQYSLNSARGPLREQGVLYPKTTTIKRRHHFLLPYAMDQTPAGSSVLNRMGFDPKEARRRAEVELENVVAQCHASDANTIIVSSEVLFRVFSEAEFKRLRGAVERMGNVVRVLVYLRSPAGYYLSNGQQMLKSSRGVPALRPYDRLERIQAFERAFGIDVEARVFDRKLLLDGDVVSDFLAWSGVPEPSRITEREEVNVSLSAEAMEVLDRVGAEKRPTNAREKRHKSALFRAVRKADSKVQGATKPRLNPAIEDWLTRINKDVLALRDERGIEFPGLDYSIVGVTEGMKPPPAERIADIVTFDAARADEIERQALKSSQSFLNRLLALRG